MNFATSVGSASVVPWVKSPSGVLRISGWKNTICQGQLEQSMFAYYKPIPREPGRPNAGFTSTSAEDRP